MVTGSCLCGDVAWEASGPLERMSHCHCSMCRKAHGSAFATYVAAAAGDFRWLRGRDQVRGFESSPGYERLFCARCGSVVPGDPATQAASARVFMPAGCLDDDPGVRPQAHIFVASKAPWHELASDGLARFETYPPGVDAPSVAERDLPRAEGVRGSCLCGGAAFVLSGELQLIVNCHCSRCRKARGAAHASNLFAPAEGFRWLRGEDLAEHFKVPDAKLFVHAFCRVCGSSLPRAREEAPVVAVPAGCLDDDPRARERIHIYCGSKAPWYDIPDGLPQFEEGPPSS